MDNKFFKASKKAIPVSIEKSLLNFFPHAINIEWNGTGEYFEALFYSDEVEHIAKLNKKGSLMEYKKNIRITEIPDAIRAKATEQGEIMSAICIFPEQAVRYEIITRNEKLERDLLLMDDQGNLLEKKQMD
ncbi:MAG: hypothetical protein IH595_09605 [Bacteroidales bacterium]|nr:hypothetical protein [Bacteroidales bacterium]